MERNGDRRSRNVVVDVVETVAEATGTDPCSLEPQLNDVIDPDALERLVEGDALTRVTFEYGGRRVVVDGDGRVRLEERVGLEERVTVGSGPGDD